MSVTDEYLADNARYAGLFSGPLPPSRQVVLAAWLNVHAILGRQDGEAHVTRNAGGVVTDDEIRSLTSSSSGRSRTRRGSSRPGPGRPSPDLDQDVCRSVTRIKASPFVPVTDSVRGFAQSLPQS